ncbi:MAG: hypothetical protein AB7T08_08855, partial [Hyphomonadaceae bacterium]
MGISALLPLKDFASADAFAAGLRVLLCAEYDNSLRVFGASGRGAPRRRAPITNFEQLCAWTAANGDASQIHAITELQDAKQKLLKAVRDLAGPPRELTLEEKHALARKELLKSIQALPPELPAIMRLVRRTLRDSYPRPFVFVSWKLVDGHLSWNTQGDGAASAHGLSPNNSELNARMHRAAHHQHTDAVYAYQLVEIAHDLRWFASGALSDLARAVKDSPPEDIRAATLLLALCATEFAETVANWRESIATRDFEDRQKQRYATAFRVIAAQNEERAKIALSWKSEALRIAAETKSAHPYWNLMTVAEAVASALAQTFEGGPTPKTVYNFLLATNDR